MLNKDMKINDKHKSQIEKLLPEPKPNSEPLLIELPSATLEQNAMLAAVVCPAFPQGTKKSKSSLKWKQNFCRDDRL
jgi:hypothetical protein